VEFFVDKDGTVSVLDHGPGVAEHERNLIFQRFWRRDRRKAGSTVLGFRSSSVSPNCIRQPSRWKIAASRRSLFAEIYTVETVVDYLRAGRRQTGSRDGDDQGQAASDPGRRGAQI